MGIKVSVEKCGDVWLVGDGGRIARALGADPGTVHNLSIGFVAEHSNHIGPCVAAMEGVLTEFTQLLVRANVARTADQLASRAKTHLDATGGPIPAQAPRGVSQAEHDKGTRNGNSGSPRPSVHRKFNVSLTLKDLSLDSRQLWRLEKALRYKSITALSLLTEEKLLAKKGIGQAIVKAVKKGLKKHGLRLTSPVG